MRYVCSQVFSIINYAIIGSTYLVSSKKKILIMNIINSIFELLADLLLFGYTGVCMCIVAIIRNIYIYKNENMSNINRNLSCLCFFLIISILSVFSYTGFWSLLIVFATFLYTYSVFAEKVITYKILGVPVEIFYIMYNIYLNNVSGIILESLIFCCTLIGYYLEHKKEINNKNKSEE